MPRPVFNPHALHKLSYIVRSAFYREGYVDKRLEFKYKLHERYAVQAYDNADVWAGNLTIELDGVRYDTVMARAFLAPDSAVEARVRAELFVADIDLATCCTGDVEAR